MSRLLLPGLLLLTVGQTPAPQPVAGFDVVIRHGTVLDGTGRPGFSADVGIRRGHIVAIGDLSASTAATDIEARGLYVAPGFINIHSHATPQGLPTAVNMLTQGVTTEITFADGSSPPNVGARLAVLGAAGLAVNLGGYVGFNSVWQRVMGNEDRRPAEGDIEQMRGFIEAGLEQGAWGVSSGLDYKPGYFARTSEVVQVVSAARPWRTNFANHDRVTPESNFSGKAGIAETIAIGEEAGLIPVATHMKTVGREKGTAADLLAMLETATRRGAYTAADAYPYLAGQTGLGALFIPGWAQEGGRPALLKRLADPATRARIVAETELALAARIGGPESVYLPETRRQLTDVMKEMQAGAGEAMMRLLEQGTPSAILRFGIEEDLVKILQDPVTSMACDCGASTSTDGHPRYYGSFPRVLGRYVREDKIMSWEEAIRKSTSLPAATIGMADRGLISVGMAADVVVFDPRTIVDHATYEDPAVLSEGVQFVLVNGQVALSGGRATGARAGRPLLRTPNLPSRPSSTTTARSLSATGVASGRSVMFDLSQSASERTPAGRITIGGTESLPAITVDALGQMQTTSGWAGVTGLAHTSVDRESRPFMAIVDTQDPAAPGLTTVIVFLEGTPPWRAAMPATGVAIK